MPIAKTIKINVNTLEGIERAVDTIKVFYPKPHLVSAGLTELLINAHEHGNLDISFEEKTELLKTMQWRDEIIKKESQPEFQKKQILITLSITPKKLALTIADEGKGFNWRESKIDDSSKTYLHGRGIAIAKLCFDQITFSKKGNKVNCITKLLDTNCCNIERGLS